jgi:hypothetical protein
MDILGHVIYDILLKFLPELDTASTHGEQKIWWILGGLLMSRLMVAVCHHSVRVVPICGPFLSFKPLSNPKHIKRSCYSGPTMLRFLPGRPCTLSELPSPGT